MVQFVSIQSKFSHLVLFSSLQPNSVHLVHNGLFRSILVPLCPHWSNSVDSIYIGPIQSILSTLIHFSPIWAIQSTLSLFGPICQLWFYSAHSVLFITQCSYSVHFGPILTTSVLFHPLWTRWVHSVHFNLIWSTLFLLSPFGHILSIWSTLFHLVQFGPFRSVWFILVNFDLFLYN